MDIRMQAFLIQTAGILTNWRKESHSMNGVYEWI
jgi:hypothetical protein